MSKTNDDPVGVENMEVEVDAATGQRKITWSYTRKVQLKDPAGEPLYESEEVGLYITEVVPDAEKNILLWANKVTPDVMATAKTQVWDSLGLDFYFTEEGIPKLEPTIPVVARQVNAMRSDPNATQPAQPQPVTSQPPAQAGTQGAPGDQPDTPAPEPTFCKGCGGRDFYDNRAEQQAKYENGQKIGPDWACKACKKGVFRKHSYDWNQALSSP